MPNNIIKPELLNQSILFARFAEAAYSDTTILSRPGLAKAQNELRYNSDNSFNQTDTQATMVRWNNDIVIAYRGTEEKLIDWWTDLNGELVRNVGGAGRIHRGFMWALDSIYKDVVRYINIHKNRENEPVKSRLFLCGHSLGGAMALTTAARLIADPTMPRIAGVFTYGAPRVGDEAYAQAYRSSGLGEKTHMWVARKDPVAHVAPFSFHYRHAVDKQYILDQSTIAMSSLDSLREIEEEEKRFPIVQGLIGIASRLKSAFLNLDTDDHSMTNSYLAQLLQVQEQLQDTSN